MKKHNPYEPYLHVLELKILSKLWIFAKSKNEEKINLMYYISTGKKVMQVNFEFLIEAHIR